MGFFGDALLRKFDAKPPQEWVEAIAELGDGQIRRGFRRLQFGWKGGVPNLPDFVRLCRSVDDGLDEGRRAPALPAPSSDGFAGDSWTMAANRYLLGHIVKRQAVNSQIYGRPASAKALCMSQRELDVLGYDRHNLDASEEFVTNIRLLVEAKNAWAADMRDQAVSGEVDAEVQKVVWKDYIDRAEAKMQQREKAA